MFIHRENTPVELRVNARGAQNLPFTTTHFDTQDDRLGPRARGTVRCESSSVGLWRVGGGFRLATNYRTAMCVTLRNDGACIAHAAQNARHSQLNLIAAFVERCDRT